jgi:RNA 2',3'-cyclic 3'-phosphodiesterase
VRLFVAVYPPPGAVEHLSGYAAGLRAVRAGARLTRAQSWHVTLAFLADLPEPQVPVLVAAVDLAAGTAPPLRLSMSGGGSFGHGQRAVLWAGLAGQVPELLELAAALRRALGRSRLPYDRKPVRPHLTLARPGRHVPPDDLAADKATLGEYQGPEWTATHLTLVESHLGPHATHTPLHQADLHQAEIGPTSAARDSRGRG